MQYVALNFRLVYYPFYTSLNLSSHLHLHTHIHTHTPTPTRTHTHTHTHTHKVVLRLFPLQQTVSELMIGVYVDPDLQNKVIVFMLPWLTNLYDIHKVSCIRLSGIGGLDWNGLNCCKNPFSWHDSFLESGYSFSSITCSMPCLGILPWRLGGQRSPAYLISFTKWLDFYIQLEFVRSIKPHMYLCLTVSIAGVCRPRKTLVVTKPCKYASTYLQHVDG